MPPPKYPGVKKRNRSKRSEEQEAQCHSMPSTPSQPHRTMEEDADAVSDTDFGFDSTWANRGSAMRPTYI